MTTIPHGYKSSLLGLIPQDWEVLNLGKIASFSKGKGLSKEDLKGAGKFKCIHYGELFRSYGTEISNVNYYTDFNQKPVFSEKNDVLMPTSDITPNGLATGSYVSEKGILLGGDILIIRSQSDDLFGLYLANYIKYDKKQIMKLVSGSTVYHIYGSDMKNFKLPLPPLPEQNAIASILSSCDESITTTQTLIDHLQSRHKALCQQLLTGKKRLQGFSEKWESIALNECLKYTPRAVEKPSGNFFALGIRSHGKGIFHKNDFDSESIAMDTLYEVRKDDFVVNITFAREQAVAIANQKDEGGLVSHRFPTYTFNLKKAIPEYFRHFILQKRFKYMLDIISPGGAGRNRVLSKKDFIKLEVYLPSPEEQTAIASILNTSQAQIDLANTKLTKLKQNKQGLMQQLLTGKTRVPSKYL